MPTVIRIRLLRIGTSSWCNGGTVFAEVTYKLAMKRTAHQTWSIHDIPYPMIERGSWRMNQPLLYLIASASFVEITSDLYTSALIDFFRPDSEVRDWLGQYWLHEEKQHGDALRLYVNAVWPDFDWEHAYENFYREYSRCCHTKQLGPTCALEMASRCLVETGTATLYTMIHRVAPEPVLRALTGLIRNDEIRHYKYFYSFFLRYREREGTNRCAVAQALWKRISEVDREDGYYAFKHTFIASHTNRHFHESDYKTFRNYFQRLASHYYPYDMAIKMLLKPLGLQPPIQRFTAALLAAGAKRMCALSGSDWETLISPTPH